MNLFKISMLLIFGLQVSLIFSSQEYVNYAKSFPRLAEGFALLKLQDSDQPSFNEYMKEELSVLDEQSDEDGDEYGARHDETVNIFADSIHHAEDIIFEGMKPTFMQVVKTAIANNDAHIVQYQDPIFQYVMRNSALGFKMKMHDQKEDIIFEGMKPTFKQIVTTAIANANKQIVTTDIANANNDAHIVQNQEEEKLNKVDQKLKIESDCYTHPPHESQFMKNIVKEWVNEKDVSLKILLWYAAQQNFDKVIDFLIQAGVDINNKNVYNQAPLWYAIDNNAIDVVKLLINAGADINNKNVYNQTPLLYAIDNNAVDLAQLLINA